MERTNAVVFSKNEKKEYVIDEIEPELVVVPQSVDGIIAS
ncbi:unnamed protein product, partial [marine sediment metagenome]